MRPGEFQYWVERQHLDTVLPFPQGYHDLRLNTKTGVLGMVAGVGSSRTAASMMALGMDPRFDLTHAYFLVAGIAGIDPAVGSLGSVVWSDYVVDGDMAHEIDAREIPQGTEAERTVWTTGYVPLGKSVPYEEPRQARFGDDGNVFRLDSGLVTWAYELTKGVDLPDTDGIRARRLQYLPGVADAAAHRPPFVLRGDDLSAGTFWHGRLMNAWAQRWVKYQTDGKGRYAVCGMEDTGTMQSLTWLARAGRWMGGGCWCCGRRRTSISSGRGSRRRSLWGRRRCGSTRRIFRRLRMRTGWGTWWWTTLWRTGRWIGNGCLRQARDS